MRASRRADRAVLACIAGLLTIGADASPVCTEAVDPGDASIVILRCAGVVIAAEADAVRSTALSLSAHPHTIQLDAGGIAISADSSALSFTALTPEAVVSGREGEWTIVVESGRTRTTVLRGTVASRLRLDGSAQVLRAGDTAPNGLDPKRMERLSQALQRSKDHP